MYFCNPNNPTATVHGKSDVAAYVEQVSRQSPGTTVLIDEAYFEFVADPAYDTAIPHALAHPTDVVMRTFSKIFGMAGLRVGYAIAQPATVQKMAAVDARVERESTGAPGGGWPSVSDTAHIAAWSSSATVKFAGVHEVLLHERRPSACRAPRGTS